MAARAATTNGAARYLRAVTLRLLIVVAAVTLGARPRRPPPRAPSRRRATGRATRRRATRARCRPPGPGRTCCTARCRARRSCENTRNWNAQPIMISGASAYRDGEFLYQDFLYDDRALAYPDEPERLARNAADIVEVRVEPLRRATAIRVTLNSMLDPEAAAVTVGLGGGDAARDDAARRRRDACPREVFVTAHGCTGDVVRARDGAPLAKPRVTTDLRRRQIDIRGPLPRLRPARARRCASAPPSGLWDAAANAYLRPDPARPAFFNVAFRDVRAVGAEHVDGRQPERGARGRRPQPAARGRRLPQARRRPRRRARRAADRAR